MLLEKPGKNGSSPTSRPALVERVRMPVIFFVDPELRKDPDAKDIQQITLSYTFYPVDSPAKGS